jgi:hypothetical protein
MSDRNGSRSSPVMPSLLKFAAVRGRPDSVAYSYRVGESGSSSIEIANYSKQITVKELTGVHATQGRVENERKKMKTCFIVFVFFYLIGIENKIENPGNEYKNGNHRI